jgi:hypothetical protein
MRECAYKKLKPQTHAKTWSWCPFSFRNVSELLHLSLQKRDPYGFIKFAKLEPSCLTLLRKLINVKNVIHGDGRDNCGFCKTWWKHHKPTCHPFVSYYRNNVSTPNTYYWRHGKLSRCVIQLSKFLNHTLATHN